MFDIRMMACMEPGTGPPANARKVKFGDAGNLESIRPEAS